MIQLMVLFLWQVDMVELIVSVLRTNHRSMSREAESVILLQAAVQPNALLEAGQVCLGPLY